MYTPEEKKNILSEERSRIARAGALAIWNRLKTPESRRIRLAKSHYARQIIHHDKETAQIWLVNSFGKDMAEEFLIKWAKDKKS